MFVSGGCQRSKVAPLRSHGEGRRPKRDELRQFPQILGSGGQQELVFGAARATEAQSDRA